MNIIFILLSVEEHWRVVLSTFCRVGNSALNRGDNNFTVEMIHRALILCISRLGFNAWTRPSGTNHQDGDCNVCRNVTKPTTFHSALKMGIAVMSKTLETLSILHNPEDVNISACRNSLQLIYESHGHTKSSVVPVLN
jgi:hypothetical protein